MKRYQHLREKALSLRRKGRTIDEIGSMLSMSRETVYYWVKGLKTRTVIRELEKRMRRKQGKAVRRMAVANRKRWRELREKAYEMGIREFDSFAKQPSFREFVMLYLTEGYRKTRNQVAITNSNSNLVVLACRWVRKLMNPEREIDYRIQCHIDNDEDDLKKFWAKVLGIEEERIGVSRKSNSGGLSGRQWRSKYGVMSVRVCDTYLKSRLDAWMDRIQEEWKQSVV